MATLYPPVPNIGRQIERAVIAYLQKVFNDEAANYNWYFTGIPAVRTGPAFDVVARKSTETVNDTRNESFNVTVEFISAGNVEAGATNPDHVWLDQDYAIGVVMAAMSVSAGNPPGDLPATIAADIQTAGRALATTGSAQAQANNADMATLNVEYVSYDGATRAEVKDGTFYLTEIRHFEIRAGNS